MQWKRAALAVAMLGAVAVLMLGALAGDAGAVEVRLHALPPVVVSTVPEAGDLEVDPALDEIRVTFSKDMLTYEMWAWVQISKESFPEVSGDVRFVSRRTCVMPVKLEPGRVYAIWLNSEKHDMFRDVQNNPAVPYLLAFKTREQAEEVNE